MAPRRSFSKTGPMDQWLELQGFYRKHTARDGSCLFRAFSEQIFYTQCVHQDVRQQCVEFMKKNKTTFEKSFEGNYEEHVARMANPRELGGHLEICAMGLLYCCNVIIFEELEQPPQSVTDYDFQKKILLCRSADDHYDSVYTKDYIAKAAFCQSIAYEMLYRNVFKFSDIEYAVEKMLHDKSNRIQREKIIAEDRLIPYGRYRFHMGISLDENNGGEQEEPIKNVKEILAQGSTPFPYKVAKALDPNIYRNIEFDIWNDFRKEMKFGWYRSNGELQVGVKCLVKLEPEKILHAHIQEMTPDKGPVVVFIEELGEKCTVAFDNLEPLPKSEKPLWPLPYKNCQHLVAMQQKSPALIASDLGNKWKKSKLAKIRKMKENLPHSLSPRLQYCSKMNSSNIKYSNQVHPRVLQERTGNIGFQKFPERLQSYNSIVHMDIPTLHASMMLEQQNTSGAQLIPQQIGMTLPSTSSLTSVSNVNSMTQPEVLGRNSPEGRASPPPQPDSTAEISSAEGASGIMESQILSDSNMHNMSAHSQYMTFTPYSRVMQPSNLVSKTEANSTLPSSSASVVNMPILSDSYCPPNNTSPYMLCNPIAPGVSQNVGHIQPGTAEQPLKEQNGSVFFQPVNFTAQKSMQPNGSDLPFADLATLRFYYNLGHDYFRMKCLCWPGLVPQVKMQPNFIQVPYPSSIGSPNLDGSPVAKANNNVNNQTLPDSTTHFQEEMLNIDQEAADNSPFSNSNNFFPQKSIAKPKSLSNCSIIPEPAHWQSSQKEAEMRSFQNPLGACGKGIKNSQEEDDNKISNSQVTRFDQNAVRLQEPYEDLKSATMQNENVESGNGLCGGERQATQGGTSVMFTSYNMTPASPSLPYSYSAIPPTFYNHALCPMFVPLDTEQNIMPLSLYPSYAIGTAPVSTIQEAVETPSPVENQCSSPVCAPMQPSNVGMENGCMQSYAFYSQPPAPLIYPQPSLSPQTGMYPGVGQMQRWIQPNVNTQAPSCVYPPSLSLPYTPSL